LEKTRQHPAVWVWVIALLWSINERLGGNKGRDFEEPTTEWIDDIAGLVRRDRMIAREAKRNGGFTPPEPEEDY